MGKGCTTTEIQTAENGETLLLFITIDTEIHMHSSWEFAPLRAANLSQKRLGDENQQDTLEEREGNRFSSAAQSGSHPGPAETGIK